MPVSRVGQGIGDVGPPAMVSRSAGMPSNDQPIADMASQTTASALPSTPTPAIVS